MLGMPQTHSLQGSSHLSMMLQVPHLKNKQYKSISLRKMWARSTFINENLEDMIRTIIPRKVAYKTRTLKACNYLQEYSKIYYCDITELII